MVSYHVAQSGTGGHSDEGVGFSSYQVRCECTNLSSVWRMWFRPWWKEHSSFIIVLVVVPARLRVFHQCGGCGSSLGDKNRVLSSVWQDVVPAWMGLCLSDEYVRYKCRAISQMVVGVSYHAGEYKC